MKIYRNIPFIDNKGSLFYFQHFGRAYWIEIPFVGFTFRVKRKQQRK